MSLLLENHPIPLGEQLRAACALTPSLIADVVDEACRRFPSQGRADKTERIKQLISMGAWTDAALALIELELPKWRIRRLAYDDGEWHCALSRQRELPDWLDDSVEGRHADLTLAMLNAFVEVQRLLADARRSSGPSVPQHPKAGFEPLLTETSPSAPWISKEQNR